MKLFTDKTLLSATLTSLAALVAGVMFFLNSWPYAEEGHSSLLLAYCGLCTLLFMVLKMRKKQFLPIVIFSLLMVVFFAYAKFDWRKDYIVSAQQGQFFVLDPYVENYPTFEDNLLAKFTDKPQWVDFAQECVEPALKGKTTRPTCKSSSMIMEAYKIDVRDLIDRHYLKMQRTAKNIEKGRIKNKGQLRACLKTKSCAMVPLLPPDVDIATLTPESDDFLNTRKAFWSLINDTEISPEVCDYMDLCRAMRDLGVVGIKKPEN